MTITVGIVDDGPRIRSCLAFYLQHTAGIEVAFSTDSAPKVLEILGNSPVRVLLSGIVMPTMDGMELLNRLRQLDTPPRFLGTTSFVSEQSP
ncbi:MAG: response regulator [Corynebacterium glucuronolyticum]|nr:response regulator [Corynebacterium glucuronolyticum]